MVPPNFAPSCSLSASGLVFSVLPKNAPLSPIARWIKVFEVGDVISALTENEPGAEVRYTLDGSVPGPADALYSVPIRLTGAAVLRARAFKSGFTRSITSQQVFEVGP